MDNTFRGGNFAIPGASNVITSMTFTANLDLALGQGSLQVGTSAFMASCVAPVNLTVLPATESPILTFSLIGTGPLGQNSTILVNSDVFFRSIPGFGTLQLARRDFSTPGNSPISDEVYDRILQRDNQKLLPYGSAIVFDNRWLITVSPQSSSQGVFHQGLVALNLDPVSGMRDKQQPVYDGLWTGINTLQLVKGLFAGTERAFAFTFNVQFSKIELYEIKKTFISAPQDNYDNGDIPIVWTFETAALFREDVKPRDTRISLRNGEFAVKDVVGTVRFEVFYRFDSSNCWIYWHSFSICVSDDSSPLDFPSLGLGEPTSDNCNSSLNTPARDGYTCQVRFIITGSCTFVRARFEAVTVPIPKFPPPICDEFIDVAEVP